MTGGLQMATQMASSQQASYQKQLKKLQAAQKKLQKQQVCPPTSSVRTFNHVACNLTVCPPHLKLITASAVKICCMNCVPALSDLLIFAVGAAPLTGY